MRRYPSAIKVLDNNKIRFNKNFDVSTSSHQEHPNPKEISSNNKGILIRKYKIGELPDIQITTKDLLDPMLFLANHDHEFASELFILLFSRMCVSARK